MQPGAFNEMKDRLLLLMEERLNARGVGLQAKVHSVRGSLPAKIRKQFEFLVAMDQRMENPKLAAKTDPAKVAAAYGVVRDYMEAIKAGKVAKRKRSGLVGTIAMQIFIVLLLGFGFLYWQGFLGG